MPKTKVLYVDDDAVHRLIVSRCFALDSDIEVVTTDCGGDALARLNAGAKFDVLLVDWNMPEMSGLDVVRNVRAAAQFSQLRIMMVTANNAMEQVTQALAAGADEYLMKPFTKEMLVTKLELLLLN